MTKTQTIEQLKKELEQYRCVIECAIETLDIPPNSRFLELVAESPYDTVETEWKPTALDKNIGVNIQGEVRDLCKGNTKQLYEGGCYHGVYVASTRHYVHRLVAETWLEHSPEQNLVLHIDGDLTNNAVGNLRWVTVEEYMKEDNSGHIDDIVFPVKCKNKVFSAGVRKLSCNFQVKSDNMTDLLVQYKTEYLRVLKETAGRSEMRRL